MIGKKAIVTYEHIINVVKENKVLPFIGGKVNIIDLEGDNICICQPIGYPEGYTFTINKCYLRVSDD